ncbi:MAG: VCBS repeat-containing protein [Gemmatimonadaceae bacterium]|nr:VCBS repeat-containing protein [Gemmatimonadaceae bacterium]
MYSTLLLVVAFAWTAAIQDLSRRFDRVQLLESEGVTSASVSIGDVDGDGDLDLILAKGRHWPLHNQVLRNDGRAQFAATPLADSADRTYSAALADLDGDGDLDMVVSNDRPDQKLVYLNDGAGHYRVGSRFGEPTWSTRYVTVADVNGDQRPDLLVANRSSNPANPRPSFVCLNAGNGTFPNCAPLPTQSATIIVAADLDGDGAVDLFVPHRDGGQSLVFWNTDKGRFASAPVAVGLAVSNTRAATAGDLDGDGRVDLVIGDEKTGLFWARQRSPRQFDTPTRLEPTPRADIPYAVVLADLDRDGRQDVVVGHDQSPGTIWFNRRAGAGGGPRFVPLQWNDGKGAVYGIAVGDLNGDGWPDIAAARSDAPNAIWLNEPAR